MADQKTAVGADLGGEMASADRQGTREHVLPVTQTTPSARNDDPDETEGRKLYRDAAESLARAQIAMARRRVTMRDARE